MTSPATTYAFHAANWGFCSALQRGGANSKTNTTRCVHPQPIAVPALQHWRLSGSMMQRELADALGVELHTIQRLELAAAQASTPSADWPRSSARINPNQWVRVDLHELDGLAGPTLTVLIGKARFCAGRQSNA